MFHKFTFTKIYPTIILAILLVFFAQNTKGQTCLVLNPATTGFTSTGASTTFVGQSFTMDGCNDGSITSIVVYSATDHTDVELRIFVGDGYAGSQLYEQTGIVLTGLVNFSLATEIALTTPVAFTSGSVYTFQLDFPAGNSSTFQLAKTTLLDFYTGGTLYENNSAMTGQDLRFVVNTNASPLPVELIGFDAKIQDGSIKLTWATASEQNNEGFWVERSADGIGWEVLGFVNGHGTTTETIGYQYIDNQPMLGMNYYLLRQIDFDGNEESHRIRAIKFEENTAMFKVSPNPATAGQALTIVGTGKESGLVVLSDMYGRPVWKNTLPENGVFTTTLPNDLPSGIYSLGLFSEGKKTSTLLRVN